MVEEGGEKVVMFRFSLLCFFGAGVVVYLYLSFVSCSVRRPLMTPSSIVRRGTRKGERKKWNDASLGFLSLRVQSEGKSSWWTSDAGFTVGSGDVHSAEQIGEQMK